MTADAPSREPWLSGPASVWRRQWPFLVVLVGVLLGLAVVVLLDRFRRGTILMAASVVFGAWMRALLPNERAGLLHVRSRAADVVTLLVLGLGLTVLALLVPPPS